MAVRRIVLLGPPGSGKGTQGKRLAGALGISYLSTGALLRGEVERGTAIGLEADTYLQRGMYVPDELMSPLVAAWLERTRDGWLLDGFPRTLVQKTFLDQARVAPECAVGLDVPEEELLRRITSRLECLVCHQVLTKGSVSEGDACPACGKGMLTAREDDAVENFRKRLASFRSLTVPVLDAYRADGILVSCDGTGSPDEVAARLASMLP